VSDYGGGGWAEGESGFFERRGREGYAEGAEGIPKIVELQIAFRKLITFSFVETQSFLIFSSFVLIYLLLRPLRNLRDLCVRLFGI
jgi:hypothetical protein